MTVQGLYIYTHDIQQNMDCFSFGLWFIFRPKIQSHSIKKTIQTVYCIQFMLLPKYVSFNGQSFDIYLFLSFFSFVPSVFLLLCFRSHHRLMYITYTNRVESSSQLPSADRNYYNATNNQAYNNPTQFNSYFSVYDDEADDTGELYRDGKQTYTHTYQQYNK